MIKFLGTKPDGSPVFGFGISDGNVERLKKGMPIVVDMEQMGLSGEVVIFYGGTDAELAIIASEMTSEDTIYREQKRYHEG